jgi:hypothetical protein
MGRPKEAAEKENRKSIRQRAKKDLHLCRLDGFENPQLKRVPYARFLDPTHGGLASAGQRISAPYGYSVGSANRYVLPRTPQRSLKPFPAYRHILASCRECNQVDEWRDNEQKKSAGPPVNTIRLTLIAGHCFLLEALIRFAIHESQVMTLVPQPIDSVRLRRSLENKLPGCPHFSERVKIAGLIGDLEMGSRVG